MTILIAISLIFQLKTVPICNVTGNTVHIIFHPQTKGFLFPSLFPSLTVNLIQLRVICKGSHNGEMD